MEWVMLGFVVIVWLISPIVLTIALVISRRQVHDLRQQLADLQATEAPPPKVSITKPYSEASVIKPAPPAPERVTKPTPPVDTVVTSPAPERVIKPPPVLPEPPVIPPATPSEPPQSSLPPVPKTPSRRTPSPLPRPKPSPPIPADDWRPAAPTPLEKMLHTLSGYPKLIAPFLAQNIGWFVGGFCFISGALFLIANTSGFLNALVVFGSLLSASAFLLWAGYQFRRKGEGLIVASSMLLTLGMLLAPLVLAMSVRLFDASDGLLIPVSILIAVGSIAAFAWIAHLSSGLMDRALQGRYSWLLTALAAMQLAAPLAVLMPDWRVLAVLHVALLGVLGYGLRTFSREWLRQLFVDRKLTTYYAAGLLVYTAMVSFVHLSWVWQEPLPVGYAAPFLMALCGLLFPVDAAFKEWTHKYSFLSRFSFALYALSVVAMAVAVQSMAAMLLTFGIGAVLYGWVTWQYRSLPPLYLLLVCVAGLYGIGILDFLSPQGWALASVPGLIALLGLAHWASSRSRAIALQCLLSFGVLLSGLTAWSLLWISPSGLGFATAGMAALLVYVAVRLARVLPKADPRWDYADAAVVLFAAVAMIYAPRILLLDGEVRAAFGWLALAVLWTALGLYDRQQSVVSRMVFTAGALLNIAAALGGVMLGSTVLGRPEPIIALLLSAALLLWLSLGLRWRSLFYAMLAVVGLAGVLFKQGYFPAASSGLLQFILVLALWMFLWWLVWRYPLEDALPEIAADLPALPPRPLSVIALIRPPLEQVMALLWVAGLGLWSLHLLGGSVSAGWLAASGFGTVAGVLLVGHFHQFRWMVLPWLLGLLGLLTGLDWIGLGLLDWIGLGLNGLGIAALLYVLSVWWLGRAALASPLLWRWARVLRFTTPEGMGGRWQVEQSLHYGAFLIAVLPVAASFVLGVLGLPFPELLPALMLGLLLFVLTGWHYRTEIHAWAALITLTVGLWSGSAEWTSPELFGIGQPLVNGLLSLCMALTVRGLETERIKSWRYWCLPLSWMSVFLYVLALAGAVLAALVMDSRLSVLLMLLCFTLFPVARQLPNAAEWRGLGLALLLSALIWSLAVQWDVNAGEFAAIAMFWGYALWIGGNLLLPPWNTRYPNWAVSPVLWSLLGLISVLFATALILNRNTGFAADAWLGLSLYLFLLLRNTAWLGMAWLAVGTLTLSGLSLVIQWWFPTDDWWGWAAALLWLNVLWLLVPLWQRFGQRVAAFSCWRQSALEPPLIWIPFAVLMLLLSGFLLLEYETLMTERVIYSSLSGLALLLAVTAAHACRLQAGELRVQVFLVALMAVLIAVMLDVALPATQLPLVLALWSGVLFLGWHYGLARSAVWSSALSIWVNGLPAVVVALLFVIPEVSGEIAAASLAVLALVALARGWWQGSAFWFHVGMVLALAGGYAIWLLDTPFAWTVLIGLLPWYALQTALCYLVFMLVRRWLVGWLDRTDPQENTDDYDRMCGLNQTIGGLLFWLLSLTLLWLGWHGYAVFAYHANWAASPWHFGIPADPLAAVAAFLLLTGVAMVKAWQRLGTSRWVYTAALWLGLLAIYGRLVVLGLTPFTPLDTGVLLAAAALASLLRGVTGARPLYHLALLLPLLALVTVPWQLGSPWTGGALLMTAVLYLSLTSALQNPLPLYLGVLALNATVYLWIPLWAEQYGLWQFYIVPAAVSVLALLHLHRRELRPAVLKGARLAALCALYAGVGLDVFLRPELMVFVLALALALASVIFGIALRIRVFLYAGVTFLVLNVLGQLIRFYPEQGLSRALILIGLGAVITAGMVLFNLKREEILQRIRIARADLDGWE